MGNKLPVIFPNLELTKTKMRVAIKQSTNDELHNTLQQIKEFGDTFVSLTKEEFMLRVRRFKKQFPKDKFETALGIIQLVARGNFSFINKGEEKLKKIMEKKKIDEGRLYTISYAVVTSNPSALKVLLEKGLIVRTTKIDWKKVETVAKEYPEILKLVENTPTEYMKGL